MSRHHLLLLALMVPPSATLLSSGAMAQQVPSRSPAQTTASVSSAGTADAAPLAPAAVQLAQSPGPSAGAAKAASAPPVSAAALLDPAPQLLPLAPSIKGNRPLSNPSVLPPAATVLPPDLQRLAAPATLALPVKASQVRIRDLRPVGLAEVETLAEVNNPNLKAIASQVAQAQSNLRAQISLWYPQLSLKGGALPTYTTGQQYSSAFTGTGQQVGNTTSSIWRMQADLEASWGLINPSRTPTIAAARDQFEQAKNKYLIGLRDLRLQADKLYFALQDADEQVRIGQESVRSSQVSLRDARARFQAGVDTKLAVLQAETQLARDQQLLTTALAQQSIARRNLAQLLNLPQDITPTARDASRVLGTWIPSLQESIVAAYAFREELDQALLDISVANSNANAALAQVQPFLNIVNTLSTGRTKGYEFVQAPIPGETGWNVNNTLGLTFNWAIYDGGRASAEYRRNKEIAEQSRFSFADRRNQVRQEVEESFYNLERNNRNITTTSREVISARESLRLARLRFQAGVTTQREVVDTQRDLTQAEVRYSTAIADYNTSLAELRRRTGLDQVAFCAPTTLSPIKPVVPGVTDVPIEPQPLQPACQAKFRPVASGRGANL